jgi:hypothetical protein
MFLLNFYRFYASLCFGAAFYFFAAHSLWFSLAIALAARVIWFATEKTVGSIRVDKLFKRHLYEFKQQLGPYGIRLANKAETDKTFKKSLTEVFVTETSVLKKNVEQLEMFDTLFKAGMQPDAETYQVHDCKLKYGKYRLEKLQK